MKLCVAEKPSVAKEIARILGATARRDGFFEGNGYWVSWTFGHLCTLKEPDDYTPQWKYWRMHTLPIIPPRFGIKVIGNDGVAKQFGVLASLMGRCDEVINCGDAGIEGELIQRWVLVKAKCAAPVKRLWISSLTDEAIREGFKSLHESSEYDRLYAAGNARAIGDWLLGMNASRLFTLKYANNKGVLSVGRVQTPTLALIVQRHQEIENFKPEPFWELKTVYREVTFSATQGRYSKKALAEAALQEIVDKLFEITSFTRKKGKEQPPRLFDLTALQVECNRKFGFTADETLKHIQQLYERKLVTYPRVDTTYLTNDMYPKIKGIMQNMQPYAAFTAPLLAKPIRKSKKVFDDKKVTDHHAIIPTGVSPQGISLPHKQVYDTIARRFLAAFYPDCEVMNTTVLGHAGEVEFKATGKVIDKEGWRVLYPKKSSDKADEGEQIMPAFVKGEQGPHQPDLQEKMTQPPKPYTEATLLRAMETAGKQVDDDELRDLMKENGIGRPSTRANIIETLFRRRYVVRVRKTLQPTVTGVGLINTIQNELLKSVELTGIWERKLRQIENGEYEATVFLDEMKKMVTDLVLEVKQERTRYITIADEEQDKHAAVEPAKASSSGEQAPQKKAPAVKKSVVMSCPRCGNGTVIKGKSAWGCSAFREGCDFRIDFTIQGKKLTDKQVEALVVKGKTGVIKGFVVDEEKVSGRVVLTPDHRPLFEPDQPAAPALPAQLTCPQCGQGILLQGRTAWGCSRYREGCKYMVTFDTLQAQFGTTRLTPELLKRVKL